MYALPSQMQTFIHVYLHMYDYNHYKQTETLMKSDILHRMGSFIISTYIGISLPLLPPIAVNKIPWQTIRRVVLNFPFYYVILKDDLVTKCTAIQLNPV